MKRSVPEYVERGRASGVELMMSEMLELIDTARERAAENPADFAFYAVGDAFYFGVAVGMACRVR